MTPENMLGIIDSDVLRFHAHRDPALRGSIGTHAHQWQAASWYLLLCPAPTLHLTRAILWHDVAEAYIGDMPGPVKSACVELAVTLAAMEAVVSEDLGLPVVTAERDLAWMKLCDRLADYVHVATIAHWQLETEDWQEARAEIGGIAQTLGVAARVEAVLSEVDA
jgi:5'-deoxynucleotidase YfbR-like HD superfamily hydrolase